jgi:hypothetical protein
MVYKAIDLTIRHGVCQPGVATFVTHGLLLANDDPRAALAFGRLALSLLDAEHPLSCSAFKIFASHIQVRLFRDGLLGEVKRWTGLERADSRVLPFFP